MKRIALLAVFVLVGLAMAQGSQTTWPTVLATILAGAGALIASIGRFTWSDWVGLFKTATFWTAISAIAAAYAGFQNHTIDAPTFIAALYGALATIFVRKGLISHARLQLESLHQQFSALGASKPPEGK